MQLQHRHLSRSRRLWRAYRPKPARCLPPRPARQVAATTLGHPRALTRVAHRLHNPTRVEATPRFRKWIDALRDRDGRARVLVRIDRLAHGHAGQHRNLPGGISELKIDVGPGYRVYYLQRGSTLLLLLAGGDKSTQDQDIAAATRLARDLGRW